MWTVGQVVDVAQFSEVNCIVAISENKQLARKSEACYVVHTRPQERLMPASTTMTIRLKLELKDRLEKLSEVTRRSNSFLAAEAIDAYVARELEIVSGIERGLADFEAGRFVSQEEAEAEIQAILDRPRGQRQ